MSNNMTLTLTITIISKTNHNRYSKRVMVRESLWSHYTLFALSAVKIHGDKWVALCYPL